MRSLARWLRDFLRRPGVRAQSEKLLPSGSTRRSIARVGVQVARDGVAYSRHLRDVVAVARQRHGGAPDYSRWLTHHRRTADNLTEQRRVLGLGGARVPLECIVVVPSGRAAAARATLAALETQSFTDWRAVVVGAEVSSSDERVTCVPCAPVELDRVVDEQILEGDPNAYVMAFEAGDEPEPDLLFWLSVSVWEHPDAALLHWDDDVIGVDGSVDDPRFRPSWSPELMLSANPLGRSFAVRRSAAQAAPPTTEVTGDARWWDLLLRVAPDPAAVIRLPKLLGHLWRRPDATPAGAEALVQAHLDRLGRRASVTRQEGALRVRLEAEWPHVSVIIPTRHNRDLLLRCFAGLRHTDYPSFDVHIIDNGERNASNERFYADLDLPVDVSVTWWTEPFNYSAVNNHAARAARGEVLVFLNDDTEAVDPGWLRELVGWAVQPDIGLVGVQLLDATGRIQHGGVILGMNGFADHLFEGMQPGSDSLIGSTTWYRNSLSVTAACVAVRRELFDSVGGFDERFVLCGSDVVLGLDMVFQGKRNVVVPFGTVLHLESATRGSSVPSADFFASFWRYQKWLFAGDPYFSPSLSLDSRTPELAGEHERTARERIEGPLNRSFTVFRQRADEEEAVVLSGVCRGDSTLAPSVAASHAETVGRHEPRSITWYVPDIDSPFYGGINTALRMADHLREHNGVENRFMVMAAPNEQFFRSALAASFPGLADAPITFFDGSIESVQAAATPTDVAIATLWVTAYGVAHVPGARRKFYLVQDFEPMFYPAGTMYALAEQSYQMGLYGLCNTDRLRDIYVDQYGQTGFGFTPAVDQGVFHPNGRRPVDHDGPVRVFIYARPGHWRNCWEMASVALAQVKARFGSDVHIVTAGSWARPDDIGTGIEHLGLMDYRDTGALYRTCDVGVALTVSAHPSYLPLELLSCGVPVVAFDNPAGNWILDHEENSLRAPRTADGLAEAIGRLVEDPALRVRLAAGGRKVIEASHASWPTAFSGVYDFLSDPEGVGRGPASG